MDIQKLVRGTVRPTEADIVLVHGLGGSGCSTWGHVDEEAFPRWLMEDLPQVDVWSVSYGASFWNDALTIGERATNFGSLLRANGLGDRSIIFVTHSLGGLITKELLFQSEQAIFSQYRHILDNCQGVVFLGTPHIGSRVASFVRSFGWGATLVRQLRYGNDFISRLKLYFMGLAREKGLRTAAYAETRKLRLLGVPTVMVVPRESAEPGTVPAVPLDKDHCQLTSPEAKSDQLYAAVLDDIRRWLPTQVQPLRYMSLAESEDTYLAFLMKDASQWVPIPRVRLGLSPNSENDLRRLKFLLGRSINKAFGEQAVVIHIGIEWSVDEEGDYIELFVPNLRFANYLVSTVMAWDRAYRLAGLVPRNDLPDHIERLLAEALAMTEESPMYEHIALDDIRPGFQTCIVEALPEPSALIMFNPPSIDMQDSGVWLPEVPTTSELLTWVAYLSTEHGAHALPLAEELPFPYQEVWQDGQHALWKVELSVEDPMEFRISDEYREPTL